MVKEVPYASLDTPAVLVDLAKLEANISEMSGFAAEAGVRFRAHIKAHMSAEIARMQLAAGACGVEVGTIGLAEAVADTGLNDIIVAHPSFYGGPKQETLKRLLRKPGLKLAIVVDMIEQAQGIAQAGQATGQEPAVLLKVDANAMFDGLARFGTMSEEATLNLAAQLHQLPGIDFIGLYAHEMPNDSTQEGMDKIAFETAAFMAETTKKLRGKGIPVDHVSVGASNTFRPTCRYIKEGKFPEITEIHPGTAVTGDIMYLKEGGVKRETCAVTVLTTVISTSHPAFAMTDAGYKTFGADYILGAVNAPDFFWNGLASFGSIQGRSDLRAGFLCAETGMVYYMDPKKKLSLGERLEIVPNNATLVNSLHDNLYGVRNGVVEKVLPMVARGRY